jgi:hypothetical protein
VQEGFTQYVTNPTRENNVLDLVLCNDNHSIISVDVIDPFSITCDHNCVDFKVACSVRFNIDSPIDVPNFSLANYQAIRNYLSTIDWLVLHKSCNTVEDFWNYFHNSLIHCIETFIPKRQLRTPNVHYPKKIRKLLALKKKYYKTNKKKYIEVSTEYDSAVKSHFDEIENNIIDSRCLKSFYRYVNSRTKSKSTIPVINHDNSMIHYDSDKCDIFNKYFVSVFTNDDNTIPDFPSRVPETVSLCEVLFPYNLVVQAIKHLPNKLSRTPDSIPMIFLKKIAENIAFPLSILFEYSMRSAQIPKIWKTALVHPIFKKGNRSLTSNYRPISLTSVSCKVMESIISDCLMSYLLRNNLLSKDQFGFVPGRSTCTNLLATLNDWTLESDNNESIDAIYIDLAKAFDTVSHKKLMLKLHAYGIHYELYHWIEAFLKGRTQATCVGKCISDFLPVTSGVIQGSVLGPILFLVFINDLPDVCIGGTKIKLFADDCKLYSSSKSAKDDLPDTLINLEKWVSLWQSTIALDKCFHLRMTRRSHPTNCFKLFGNDIRQSHSITDLGVHISADFKSHTHCDYITSKAYSRINLLFRSFLTCNPSALIKAYTTYVRPILENCTQVWSPYMSCDIIKLEKVQKYVTRRIFIKCKLSYSDYSERLRILALQTLETRRIIFDLTLVFKIVNRLIDLNLNDYFTLSTYLDRPTRGHFLKLKCQTISKHNFRANFFCNRIIPIWNSLPATVISAPSVANFKVLVRTHFVNLGNE